MKDIIKPLYHTKYRNLSHARLDFHDFLKELNISIKKNIPKEYWFNIKMKDHFLDRLMDRKANPDYIKKIIKDSFHRNICEILYFKTISNKDNSRICLTDTVNHVFLSYDKEYNSFTLRSFFHNPERVASKLNPEFTISPVRKMKFDEY